MGTTERSRQTRPGYRTQFSIEGDHRNVGELRHARTVWKALDRWRRFFILLHLGATSSNVQCSDARCRT